MAVAAVEYEPDEESILADLLPRNVAIQVFRALLENAASEQGSRMTAMDNATRNAGDMINKLTIQYNRTRQAAITTELVENWSKSSLAPKRSKQSRSKQGIDNGNRSPIDLRRRSRTGGRQARADGTRQNLRSGKTTAAPKVAATVATTNNVGRISQVIGAVVDVAFPQGICPRSFRRSRPTITATASCSKLRSISARTRFAPSPWTRPRA
jgi:hypothetical protein